MTRVEESAALKNRAEKKKAAANLHETAQNGARALEEGDAEAYLNTFETRETLLSRIDVLEKEYAALERAAEDAAALSKLEDETRAVLEAVLREDEAAREKGQTLMSEYREKLRELRKSGKQVAGYTSLNRQSDSIFIDKKR